MLFRKIDQKCHTVYICHFAVYFNRFLCFAEATTPVEESAHNQLSKLASITLDVARLSSGDRPRSGPPLG